MLFICLAFVAYETKFSGIAGVKIAKYTIKCKLAEKPLFSPWETALMILSSSPYEQGVKQMQMASSVVMIFHCICLVWISTPTIFS